MAFQPEDYRRAREIIKNRKIENARKLELRKERAYSECPRLREIELELRKIGTEIFGLTAGLEPESDGKELDALADQLKNKSLALQSERRELLTKNGFGESYLDEIYTCKECRDTGVLGAGVRCKCFERVLKAVSLERLNDSISLEGYSFDSFDLSFYPKESNSSSNAYETARQALEYSVSYAEHFGKGSGNILFMGKTGLGKTHLSLAIASEVAKKGYAVMYQSSPALFSKIEREKFSPSQSETRDSLKMAIDCDLLIIDDLGTEFQSSFVRSSIYDLINSRLSFNRPTIINTNLTPEELGSTYADRVSSRIFAGYKAFLLTGNDIRIKKALMQK